MTKVNNRRVIRRLAFRELKSDWKMNLMVILSIVLTCILFTALISIGGGLVNGIQRETMRQVGGDKMAGLKCVLPEDYEKVKEDSATRDVVYRIIVGNAVNEDLKNISVEINCAENDDAAKSMFCAPTTGRLPESAEEIAVSTLVLDELHLPHELGTTVPITLDVDGEITEHAFTLCGYWQGEKLAMAQIAWVSRAFADEYAPTPTVPFHAQEILTYAGYWQVDFNYVNSFDIEGKTDALLNRLYGDQTNAPDIGINWAYTTSSVDGGMVVSGIVILLVIFAAGYLIIYNIFHINISANIRNYGLLKTIGTTARQIQQMVRTQAVIYCAVGIPLGLVSGVLLGNVLMQSIVRTMNIGSMESYSVSAKLLVILCLVSAMFTYETVMISCRKPCRIAGNVSPIEALRYNDTDMGLKISARKTGRISPFSVARNNMSRSRKKTAVVVLSLTLSMVLVNTLFTFLNGVDMEKFISFQIVGDFVVKQTETASIVEPDDLRKITPGQVNALEQTDGVSQVCPVYFEYGDLHLSGNAMEKAEKLYEKYADAEKWDAVYDNENDSRWENPDFSNYLELRLLARGGESGKRKGDLSADIYGIRPDLFSALTPVRGELDKEKFASGSYALVYTSYIEIDDEEITDDDFYEPGDVLTLSCGENRREYEVMAVCDIPYGLSSQRYSFIYGHVMIPESEYFSLTDNRNAMSVMLNAKEDRYDDVDAQIRGLVEQDSRLIMKNKQDYEAEYADFINMFKLVGGTLSGILALIGILNFVNAVMTGILSRKRELAMMTAIGMTGSQMGQMLMWEGIHYAALTALGSVACSTLVSLLAVKGIAADMFFFSYHFTLLPLVICIPVLLLLSAVIPYFAYRSICRESVVDRLREN